MTGESARFRDDVLRGLRLPRKRLPFKYLYDEAGSALFEQVTKLPEYYPARLELQLLAEHGVAMAEALGPDVLLIEYGSGNANKTRALLRGLASPAGYVPIDISKAQLMAVSDALRQSFPGLVVHPLAADFTKPFALPEAVRGVRQKVVFFPGCTIWNLELSAARQLLHDIAQLIRPAGALLIAVDLAKDPTILQRAYDDPAGVTADFNRNILRHINRVVGADFRPERFVHRATWNGARHRIELTLESVGTQTVDIAGERVDIGDGEAILTEVSYKLEQGFFEEIAADAGFTTTHRWVDDAGWYSLQLLRPC